MTFLTSILGKVIKPPFTSLEFLFIEYYFLIHLKYIEQTKA